MNSQMIIGHNKYIISDYESGGRIQIDCTLMQTKVNVVDVDRTLFQMTYKDMFIREFF